MADSALLSASPRESAERIMADDGTWTKGDVRLCAEFVLAANADLHERVEAARKALDEGDEAVILYLRGDSK